MDLIRHAETSVQAPAPVDHIPPTGSPDDRTGWFVDCNLENGILGTPIMAQWANMMQAEIRNAVTKAGLTPNYASWSQLGEAIEKLARESPLASETVAGRVELATLEEAVAGADGVRAVTPAGVGAALKAGRGIREAKSFLQSGSFTVPAGVTRVMVEVWSGGGGAGQTGSGGNSCGGGGGGGGYGSGFYDVLPGSVIPVTVGSGGSAAASANADGQPGGTSSFGSFLSVTGGTGGGPGGVSASGAPGLGGVVIGVVSGEEPFIGITGQRGSYGGRLVDIMGAAGGDAPRGGGGGFVTSGSGRPGVVPGGGGGSAGSSGAGTSGDGAAGMVVVYY